MKYLLDTDVIIDFSHQKEPGFSMIQKVAGNPVSISIITWTEIVFGIKKSHNPKKKLEEFDDFLQSLAIKIVDIDLPVAESFTTIKIELEQKKSILANPDIFIAATAISHKLTLVTRNVKHFARIKGLKLHPGLEK